MTQSEPDESGTAKPIASGLAYSALCNLRNTEGHLRWMGAQLGIVLNIPGWAAVAVRVVSQPSVTELWLLAFGSFVFAIANGLLFEIQRRDTKLMEFWNRSLRQLEEANQIEGGVKVFTSKRYRRLERSRDRIGKRLLTLSVVSIVAWILLMVVMITISVFTLTKGA